MRKSLNEELDKSPHLAIQPWDTKSKVHQKAAKKVQGRTITYLTVVERDQKEEMAKYKPEMFMLENLIDSGAATELREANVSLSTLNMLDQMEEGAGRELERMDAEEWAKKYMSQLKEKKEPQKQ